MKNVSFKWIVFNVLLFIFLSKAYLVENSLAIENNRFRDAQTLIEETVSKYPEIVRLTIHAVPSGEKDSRIIACNIKEKIGKPSGQEDLETMKNNKTIVFKEGDNLDITTPIYDKTGKPIAATGITLRYKKGEGENKVVERAKSIARELTNYIHKAGKPLW